MGKRIPIGKVITIVQQKGGATKTTTAINLLGSLKEMGFSTVLCDMNQEKTDALYCSENGQDLINDVIELFDENPRPKVNELKQNHDFVILDTPPELTQAALKAVFLSDLVIIPTDSALTERKALTKSANAVLFAEKPYKFLASKIILRTNAAKELLEQLEETGKAFKTAITYTINMQEMQKKGTWIGAYAPNSQWHKQVIELTKEVLNDLGVNL